MEITTTDLVVATAAVTAVAAKVDMAVETKDMAETPATRTDRSFISPIVLQSTHG